MTAMLPDAFRHTMAAVPTPVAVVTTVVGGVAHGTTVSSWTSLSMRPPMALVSLNNRSRLLAQLQLSGRFGVNILGVEQVSVAQAFASKDDEKFGALSWHLENELPRLAGITGWLACDVNEFIPGGDHIIVLGTVVAAERVGSAPLTYHERRFGTHIPLPLTREPEASCVTCPRQ